MTETRDWPTMTLVGGGQMARALIGGWLQRGAPPERITVIDPAAAQRDWMAREFPGLRLQGEPDSISAEAAIWILAVKPQVLRRVAESLASLAERHRPLVISVAAGIRSHDLARWLGSGARIVRAMPNRPALIGRGITGLYADATITQNDRARAATLLEAVGGTVWVASEAQIDAVTAVSGSGPAYFFLLIEALQAAAEQRGLPPETARRLALDTAFGAAALAHESSDDPATLRVQVTSPNGTTAAALAVFEAAHFRDTVAQAVAAAADRADQMARDFGRDST